MPLMSRAAVVVFSACVLVVAAGARADDDPGEPGERIEVTGEAPVLPGTLAIDAAVARDTPGALGEPLRALALLPGVTTSIAASGYPIVRGTLPGESRFSFDGIEIPMLYHLLIGNQTIHPSFIGNLELRAGGHGAEHGQLLGGLIAMTPADGGRERTELRASPIEAGAFLTRQLARETAIAAAVRAGTLAAPAKLYNTGAALYTIDQQTRLVHRLGNGDRLALTSLGAFDQAAPKPDPSREIFRLGFHRLDARWTRKRDAWSLRAGAQSEFDTLQRVFIPHRDPSFPDPVPRPTTREGGRSYGARAYADGSVQLARWLTARGGIAARRRMLYGGAFPLSLGDRVDPFLGLARAVDSEGAWSELALRFGRFEVTPGVRADSFRAEMEALAVRHGSVDPRLAIAARLPGGARVELALGTYTAPPQLSVIEESIVMGPLPMADGAAANAGLSRSKQLQASAQLPLGDALRADVAAYYRDTRYSVDFALADREIESVAGPCELGRRAYLYRDVATRAFGFEALVRRDLGRAVTGWVSYSLGKIDRAFDFGRLPHDFDQRHTLNATAQWRRGKWRFGATGNVHTGRPLMYPGLRVCESEGASSVGTSKDPRQLRRAPLAWRIDLRAERRFQFATWSMTGYFEIQNASFTKEVIGYDARNVDFAARTFDVHEDTLFLPLPMIGIEAEL